MNIVCIFTNENSNHEKTRLLKPTLGIQVHNHDLAITTEGNPLGPFIFGNSNFYFYLLYIYRGHIKYFHNKKLCAFAPTHPTALKRTH